MNTRFFENCIIIDGIVHTITRQNNVSDDDMTYNPCELCSLQRICKQQNGELCSYFNASHKEYFQQSAYASKRVTIDLFDI